MLLTPAERLIAKRYILPAKGEGFIFMVASISLVAVMLGVMALVIVMSVMNGFRAELFDKIVGLNGHAIVQGYDGRLDDWRQVLEKVRRTPGVVSARPLVDQPLLANFNGRVEPAIVRGQRVSDLVGNAELKILAGDLKELRPGSQNIIIGSGLAQNLGATVGSHVSIINPAGRATPFGTVPREISYRVAAVFEIGVYDLDKAYAIMPIEDAQTLMLLGDAVSMIELTTDNPDKVGDILRPLAPRLAKDGVITDWRTMNSSLFQALEVERVAMFTVLSIIVLVAVFNILSSLIMLVRAKTRDIAILRTMGASRQSMMKIFVTVGVSIGVLGTATGLLLGLVFLHFRQSVVNAIQLVTGQNLWDPSIRFLTELPSKVDPLEIVGICALAIVFSFLATLYPAYKAANTDPVEVLRYE